MRRKTISSALIALLLTPLTVNAQKEGRPEWDNEYISGVNKEEACQIAIPFADEQQATTSVTEESPYYMTLNGTWKFHWVADPKDRPQEFYQLDYDVSQWDNIKVPATWQIEAVRNNKNWDKPLYCNTIYPFCDWRHVQWPNVIQPRPADYTFASMPNPVGSYRREFTLPDSWKGRDVFIRFNGVEAGFYIWVNGKKVGYSEDSYLPAEFNLTPYLKPGKNVLAVKYTASQMVVIWSVRISGVSVVFSEMCLYGLLPKHRSEISSSVQTWIKHIKMQQYLWMLQLPVKRATAKSLQKLPL